METEIPCPRLVLTSLPLLPLLRTQHGVAGPSGRVARPSKFLLTMLPQCPFLLGTQPLLQSGGPALQPG